MRDEFMELIPTERKDATQHSAHKKKTETIYAGFDAEYWHDAYMKLYAEYHEFHGQMTAYCATLESTVESQQKIISDYENMIDEFCDKLEAEDDDDDYEEEDTEPVRRKNYFDHGIGLDIRVDEEPKLYKLSDPDGTQPKRRFDGVTFEVQPGRGFAISPKWK